MTAFQVLGILLCFAGLQQVSCLRCACQQDPSCDNLNFCTAQDGGQCYASLFKEDNGQVSRRMLCLAPNVLIPKKRPLICEYNHRRNHRFVSGCCKVGDYCNENLQLVLNITEAAENSAAAQNYGSENSTNQLFLPLLAATFGLVLLLALIATVLRLTVFKNRRNPSCCSCWNDKLVGIGGSDGGYHQVMAKSHDESTVKAGTGITAVTGSELNDYLTNTNSGSGSGLPLLVQRSVARQVDWFLTNFDQFSMQFDLFIGNAAGHNRPRTIRRSLERSMAWRICCSQDFQLHWREIVVSWGGNLPDCHATTWKHFGFHCRW